MIRLKFVVLKEKRSGNTAAPFFYFAATLYRSEASSILKVVVTELSVVERN